MCILGYVLQNILSFFFAQPLHVLPELEKKIKSTLSKNLIYFNLFSCWVPEEYLCSSSSAKCLIIRNSMFFSTHCIRYSSYEYCSWQKKISRFYCRVLQSSCICISLSIVVVVAAVAAAAAAVPPASSWDKPPQLRACVKKCETKSFHCCASVYRKKCLFFTWISLPLWPVWSPNDLWPKDPGHRSQPGISRRPGGPLPLPKEKRKKMLHISQFWPFSNTVL